MISLQLNFAASARVLTAMKEDVRDEIARQQDVTHLPHMKEGAKIEEIVEDVEFAGNPEEMQERAAELYDQLCLRSFQVVVLL